jgi:hypothetical protein
MHEDLQTYVKLDHFRSKQYESDAKLSNARIRWCPPDTYTVNDKAKTLKDYFDDPERLP